MISLNNNIVFVLFVCFMFINHTILEQIIPFPFVLYPYAIFVNLFVVKIILYFFNQGNIVTPENRIRIYILLTILLFFYEGFSFNTSFLSFSLFKANSPNDSLSDYIKYYSLTLTQFYILFIGRKHISKIIKTTLLFFLFTIMIYIFLDFLISQNIRFYRISIFQLNFTLLRYLTDIIFIVYSFKKYTEIKDYKTA